jgi:hypothetical protein
VVGMNSVSFAWTDQSQTINKNNKINSKITAQWQMVIAGTFHYYFSYSEHFDLYLENINLEIFG